THTEFHDTREFDPGARDRMPAYAWMSAGEVVDASLRGLERGQIVVVPGALNQILAAVLNTPLGELFQEAVWARRRDSHRPELVVE
ncbi:MAG: hypothetical protein AB1758_30150, partial [Candidatus Eremiobacterota bacterium]